ncbi:MAG: hypothetical protein M3436_17245 [Pseudomonadota bacterium]|nr:hypothetical protein [Pseudomonadota bacterium]
MGKQFRDLKSLGCESAGSYSRDKSTQEWKGKVLVVEEAAGRRMSDVEYGRKLGVHALGPHAGTAQAGDQGWEWRPGPIERAARAISLSKVNWRIVQGKIWV